MATKLGRKAVTKDDHVLEESIKAEQYSRVPRSVLYDADLLSSSKVVYAVMAVHVKQGRTACIGERRIAKLLGISRPTVERAIAQLVKREHVKVVGEGSSRRIYVLKSNVFAQKQGKVNEVVSCPTGYRRASMRQTA